LRNTPENLIFSNNAVKTSNPAHCFSFVSKAAGYALITETDFMPKFYIFFLSEQDVVVSMSPAL
jgi:Zn/Cd-binding protein ZinT